MNPSSSILVLSNAADRRAILAPLANRAETGSATPFQMPADGWVQLAPIGEFPHHSGVVQIIDLKAVESMAARFAQEMPGGVPGLLLDYEHFSHDPEGSTEAAGWIEGLEARGADGLWGKIRYSDEGRAAVAGGRYRFLSPTWLQPDCEWDGTDGTRLRPLRLNDAGLTNSPNLKGLAPLSNRQQPAADDTTQKTSTTQKKTMDYKAMLLKALGLPPEATDPDIETALNTAMGNAKKATEEMPKLENRYKVLLDSQAESDLDAAGITNADLRKDWKDQLLANRDTTLRLLGSLAKENGTKVATTLTNRAGAQTPDKKLPEVEAKNVGQLQREAIAAERLANRSLTNEAAFELARQKQPDLFKRQQD